MKKPQLRIRSFWFNKTAIGLKNKIARKWMACKYVTVQAIMISTNLSEWSIRIIKLNYFKDYEFPNYIQILGLAISGTLSVSSISRKATQ